MENQATMPIEHQARIPIPIPESWELELYKCVAKGKSDSIRQFDLQPPSESKDTVLHFAVKLREIDCIKEILKLCPSLLLCQNSKGDTALHIAARNGVDDIVELLINQAKQRITSAHDDIEGGEDEASQVESLIRMVNKKKDTALHEAVRNHRLYDGKREEKYFKVVKLLTEADRKFEYFANNAGETPLYMAAEEGLSGFVRQILEACPSSEFGGPYGRTALHAALFRRCEDTVDILLDKIPSGRRQDLIGTVDDDERTSLHFAVLYNDSYFARIVEQLLEYDISLAYKADKGGILPVHLAAQLDIPNVLYMFFEHCPSCLEHVDNKGWNVFHFAAEKSSDILLRTVLISGKNELLKRMVNEVDNEGNTPLHVAVKNQNLTAADMILRSGIVDKFSMNNQCLYPIDILDEMGEMERFLMDPLRKYWRGLRSPNLRREKIYEEKMKKHDDREIQEHQQSKVGSKEDEERNQTHLVVATLVATVTFAAAFTMPGGYKDDDGTAILATNVAFQAFVILNSLSFTSAVAAVFLHVWATLYPRPLFARFLSPISSRLIVFASLEMVAAFMAGTFVVLRNSHILAGSVFCICGFFYLCALIYVILARLAPILNNLLLVLTRFVDWAIRKVELAKKENEMKEKNEEREKMMASS